jgi:NADPH-dependent 2,4-dienoyl-CoA reductase/sulfur reductase-like enzyme
VGDASGSIAVVGAGLAGLRSCQGLRARGFDGRLTLIGEEPHLPYDRPPLSKQFLAGDWGADRVMLDPPDKIDALGLDLRLGPDCRAVKLDLGSRRVGLVGGDEVGFDGLVLATGSSARLLPGISGVANVHVLRTLDDAERLRAALVPGRRLGLAGAGFIGLEVAATARKLGVNVTIVEPLDVPLGRALGPVAGGACETMHREEGVLFHLRKTIDSVTERAGTLECRLSDGTVLEFDALLVGVGAAPSLDWLAGSGLTAGPGGIEVDRHLLAGPGVAVAGDVARWPLPAASGFAPEYVRVEHRTNAAEQGDHAAASLLADLGWASGAATSEPAELPSYSVPYVWSDQFAVKIQVLGLPRPDDEVTVVEGSPFERRFVALHARDGLLSAAVGFSRPRHVMTLRPLLERHAAIGEATALFG